MLYGSFCGRRIFLEISSFNLCWNCSEPPPLFNSNIVKLKLINSWLFQICATIHCELYSFPLKHLNFNSFNLTAYTLPLLLLYVMSSGGDLERLISLNIWDNFLNCQRQLLVMLFGWIRIHTNQTRFHMCIPDRGGRKSYLIWSYIFCRNLFTRNPGIGTCAYLNNFSSYKYS